MNYLNEFDPVAAAWLAELRDAGLIPPCEIDTRSIEDVKPNELRGYAQCHFFAGIGGWPLALQLAGWPADRPVWTGSCPCQPFSAAGQGAAFADERHLWPAFHWLIEQCRPAAVFGEQVASKAVDPWIDLVSTDLEVLGYAVGAIAFPAAGVGAPHIRDRTYWVGYADDARSQGYAGDGGAAGWKGSERSAAAAGVLGRLGYSTEQSRERVAGGVSRTQTEEHEKRLSVYGGLLVRPEHAGEGVGANGAGPVNGRWRAADWLGCRDGKWRPVSPGTFPLAHGIPARVGRLRGYGNAIVPQAAEEFIRAVMGGAI